MGLLLRMCQLMRTLLQHELMEENDEFEDVEIGKEGVIPAGNAGVPLLDPVLAQQILSLLKGLAGQGMFPSSQAPANSHVAGTAPKSSEIVGNDDFFHPFFGLVMTENEHDMLTKFLKLKTPIFHGSETEDAYEIIIEYYERLYKLGIVLSLCPSNFKENPRNGGGHTWNAGILLYPRLLRPNFMLCS